MPKQQKEINLFSQGIILNADEQDIPINAATYSLNINPNTKDGILSGIKSNRFISAIDNHSSRTVFPLTYGAVPTSLNDLDCPKMDNEALIVNDITLFEQSKNISFIGTEGYKEQLNLTYATPHMERLIIAQSQLGNTVGTANTYGIFEPASAINTSNTIIATNHADTTTELEDYLAIGDYIQFSTSTSFAEPSVYEIMKVIGINDSGNSITVERGCFNSIKKTYATSTEYHVFVNKISYNLKGHQTTTKMGYLTGEGWGTISGNHLKGSPIMSLAVANTPLKHTVSGDATKVVFDADAKTMVISGSSALELHISVGDSITIYTTAHGDSNNHGSTFKVIAVNGQTYYFDTAPVSETVNTSTTFYFEPGLLKNSTFFHKSASSGVGDAENYKVNDWYMTGKGNSLLLNNSIELDNGTGSIVQASGNIYTDTNLFGGDLSASYYPYAAKHITLTSNYRTYSVIDGYNQTANEAFNAGDTLLRFEDAAQNVLRKYLFSKGDIIYLDNNSDGSSPTEYMKVREVRTDGLLVQRGLYGTADVTHSASQYVYKIEGHELNQDISKDLLKSDTEYELTFWSKLNTGAQATARITAVSATINDYEGKTFTLTSAAGTEKTYRFDDDNTEGATGTVDTADDNAVIIQINGFSGTSAEIKTLIRDEIEEAIEHANGHYGEITVADNSTDAIDITQANHGESGNTEITTDAATDIFTKTDFTGGLSSEGTFSLEVNGGYIDSDGNWKPFLQSDTNVGYQGSFAVPATFYKYNTFDKCNDTRGIRSQEFRIIDNLKWRQLSFRFKTPKEDITTDMKLSFGNIGAKSTQIALSHVNLCEEAEIYDSSLNSGFMKSSGFIKNKGEKDLVMFDSRNSALRIIKNFNKDNSLTSLSNIDMSSTGTLQASSSLGDATFTSKNREVHIGFGPAKSDSAPKWIGYLNHKLFGLSNEGLYSDSDEVGSYDSSGANNFDKICLAGEWECITAVWDNGNTTLEVDMGSGNTHGLTAGDNIIVREYMDTDNSWTGAGVWFVSALDNAAGGGATRYFRCRRNTLLDDNPPNNGSMTDGDNNYRISFRPYYYYAIRRNDNYIYRISPNIRIDNTTSTDSDYPKGLIERSQELNFSVTSICCSYSKNGNTPDGGHIYVLSSSGDRIYRMNMNIAYNEWKKANIITTESVEMIYKSFKWSNLRTDGNIGVTTEVYDSLAEESSPTIQISGMPSDIIETKGPVSTFDWDDTDNKNSDVAPTNFDTRLWIQASPVGETDTFTDGDRFLFCGKTEYQDGNNTVYFADRTPPTVARYGIHKVDAILWDNLRKANLFFESGPFINPDEEDLNLTSNEGLEPGYVGARALFESRLKEDNYNDTVVVEGWKPLSQFNFDTFMPEPTQSEDYGCWNHSKPYVSWGNNVGWDGSGGKKSAIKVARYGLFQIADNDGDGLLDGTGVVVPNNENITASDDLRYGDLSRRVSSHAVGLIGSSELNWISHAGRQKSQDTNSTSDEESYTYPTDYTVSHAFLRNFQQDAPELMDASKVVFVCTDMHFGDYPQHDRYTVSSIDSSGTNFGASAGHFTKITTSENCNLQAGDLVYFDGGGDWSGWGTPQTVVAVKDANEFYVRVASAGAGNDSGEVFIGGFQRNKSGSGTYYSARGVTRDDNNGSLPYHYAFNDSDKSDGSIFNRHGGFGRLWYTDQNNFGPGNNYNIKTAFPAIQPLVEQLNWLSGFMIRPFDMDEDGFQKLLIGEGTSVDMPSFPDVIYHTGTAVKSGTDTSNQLASRLFITCPGQEDSNGEMLDSKVFVCEWSFLYPNESSWITKDAEVVNDPAYEQYWDIYFWGPQDSTSINQLAAKDVLFAGTIDDYFSSATDATGKRNATIHPVVEIDYDDVHYPSINHGPGSDNLFTTWTRNTNCLSGLCLTIVDQATGYTQTRKIVKSLSLGSTANIYLSVHYPFAHTPANNDKYYVWRAPSVATAPVRLVREETFRFDDSSAYSQDPTLAGNMYFNKNNDIGGNTAITGDGTTATATTTDYHNLTTGDTIIMDSPYAYQGTYEIKVITPKKFTFPHTSSLSTNYSEWILPDESSSSAANPTNVPLNAPAIKMNFGDLDMRKLKTATIDSIDDNNETVSGEVRAELTASANHEMFTGNSITLKNAASDTVFNGSYIISSVAAGTTKIDIPHNSTAGDVSDNYNLTTNQWGGIGASSKGSSTVGDIRAGLAQWDKGNIDGNIRRYDVEDDTRFISATESSLLIKAATIESTTGFFKKNTDYRYKVSLIYDGYQEGPLSAASWRYQESTTTEKLDISVSVKNPSKRLTAVCLYRKDTPDSFYRLVRQFDTISGWARIGNAYRYNLEDNGKVFASYESRTGISERNRNLSIKYGLSCELDGYLFAGNCSHSEIENASNQIFRSKPGKWSIFDWSVDFVVLNNTPTAMAAFLGKLIVFDKNTLYKINPQTLTIEDIFEGVGCSGKNSLIVTEYGMFFANRQGAYMYDGSTPVKISTPIQSGGETSMLSLSDSSTVGTNEINDLSWENTAGNLNSNSPYVVFDSKNNLVYFIVEFINAEDLLYGITNATNTANRSHTKKHSYIWSFAFQKSRWDLWELASNNEEVGKPFSGDDGEVFISIGNGLFQIQGGSNNLLYTWMTKKLIMDTATVKKVFNKVKIVGPKKNLILDGRHSNDSDKLIISTDKGRITSGSDSTTSNITYKSDGNESADYKLKSSNKTAKWIQVRFEEMDEDVKAAAFIYRLRAIK